MLKKFNQFLIKESNDTTTELDNIKSKFDSFVLSNFNSLVEQGLGINTKIEYITDFIQKKIYLVYSFTLHQRDFFLDGEALKILGDEDYSDFENLEFRESMFLSTYNKVLDVFIKKYSLDNIRTGLGDVYTTKNDNPSFFELYRPIISIKRGTTHISQGAMYDGRDYKNRHTTEICIKSFNMADSIVDTLKVLNIQAIIRKDTVILDLEATPPAVYLSAMSLAAAVNIERNTFHHIIAEDFVENVMPQAYKHTYEYVYSKKVRKFIEGNYICRIGELKDVSCPVDIMDKFYTKPITEIFEACIRKLSKKIDSRLQKYYGLSLSQMTYQNQYENDFLYIPLNSKVVDIITKNIDKDVSNFIHLMYIRPHYKAVEIGLKTEYLYDGLDKKNLNVIIPEAFDEIVAKFIKDLNLVEK
jgi:hypothetical protein